MSLTQSTTSQSVFVQSVADIQDAVRSAEKVYPKGGGTKSALFEPDTEGYALTVLEMDSLSGILEYQPDEYTFTALAGTTIAEVEVALAKNGQYLPFDPLLAQQGSTLGGTVAAGLSGSGRYRYGGVRDFFLGMRFVDGEGDLVLGGGKVVKNAAGFDTPKLLVGSLGRLGIMVELTFKVFPRPKVYQTLTVAYATMTDAIERLSRLVVAPLDVDAVDLDLSMGPSPLLIIRVGGLESSLPGRMARLQSMVGEGTLIEDTQEQRLWADVGNFSWVPTDASLVKVPVSPTRLIDLDHHLAAAGASRRYIAGGHLCWVAWSGPLNELDALLVRASLSGLVVRRSEDARNRQGARTSGSASSVYLGPRNGLAFAQRIKTGIDPQNRFVTL